MAGNIEFDVVIEDDNDEDDDEDAEEEEAVPAFNILDLLRGK